MQSEFVGLLKHQFRIAVWTAGILPAHPPSSSSARPAVVNTSVGLCGGGQPSRGTLVNSGPVEHFKVLFLRLHSSISPILGFCCLPHSSPPWIEAL